MPKDVREAAERVIRGYMNASTCKDRLPFLLNPEKNGAMILEYYSAVGCKVKLKSMDASDCARAKYNACSVKVRMRVPLGPTHSDEEHTYCISLTPEPKIDWRCSKGYNPVALARFKALHDDGRAGKFRVWAALSDVYLDLYADAGDGLLSLGMRDVEGATINGYVRRETDVAKLLSEALKDKQPHQIAVELSYSRSNKDPNAAAVLTLYGLSWREFPDEFE